MEAAAPRKCDVPHLLKALLEDLAAELDLASGRWRAELIFEHGRLREMFRHEERMPADSLFERFPETQARLARFAEELPQAAGETPAFPRFVAEARRH